jgi:predicted Ser/Thr protein kinase
VNLIGTRIGSYVVERELGSGGAGTVYACRHTMIDREVAVKLLHDEQVRDPDQVARFFQEAKAAADIGHPNIIVIIDYGALELPTGTRTYVMMESLDGESLDKRMRRGGLSSDDILHVLNQIASALVACHGKGIVHRDLKPSNIFLCHRSFDPLFVKVLDFGTAKLTAPAPGMRRTQYGVVMGTPAYMSPEQCEGKGAIDHRSDIYSLGCMLYELLTGTLPFEGSLGDILLAHMTRVPDPPRVRNPSVPPEWEALCLRMMEKSREARFQSVTQLAHALEDLRGHAVTYQAALLARASSGHSGHTMIVSGPNDARETLRVDVGAALPTGAYAAADEPPVRKTPPGGYTAPVMAHPLPIMPTGGYAAAPAERAAVIPALPTGGYPAPVEVTSFDPRSGCHALIEDPRHAAFARTLMARPVGRWFEVAEVCQTASVAQPATLPFELGLFVTWLDHPYPDPGQAAVVFLSLRTGWSSVVLCGRVR